MTARSLVDPDAVAAVIHAVPDPELPALTLGMLGVVHAVAIDGGQVTVELLPTFLGCPATEVMAEDVRASVSDLAGVTGVTVRFLHTPAWTPNRISQDGHDALRSFGIAPPTGRSTLPVIGTEPALPCPWCGSTDTEQDSMFGPTPCRDLRFCSACQQPFEAFRA